MPYKVTVTTLTGTVTELEHNCQVSHESHINLTRALLSALLLASPTELASSHEAVIRLPPPAIRIPAHDNLLTASARSLLQAYKCLGRLRPVIYVAYAHSVL